MISGVKCSSRLQNCHEFQFGIPYDRTRVFEAVGRLSKHQPMIQLTFLQPSFKHNLFHLFNKIHQQI